MGVLVKSVGLGANSPSSPLGLLLVSSVALGKLFNLCDGLSVKWE